MVTVANIFTGNFQKNVNISFENELNLKKDGNYFYKQYI